MATTERLKGYNAAMVAAGVMPEPELVESSNYRVPSGEAAAAKLLALPDPPTAILAFSHNLAVGAMHAAHALGLQLPRDLSIVGFDDSEQASNVRPALTTASRSPRWDEWQSES
jgi:LacI family transcriptional regulator